VREVEFIEPAQASIVLGQPEDATLWTGPSGPNRGTETAQRKGRCPASSNFRVKAGDRAASRLTEAGGNP